MHVIRATNRIHTKVRAPPKTLSSRACKPAPANPRNRTIKAHPYHRTYPILFQPAAQQRAGGQVGKGAKGDPSPAPAADCHAMLCASAKFPLLSVRNGLSLRLRLPLRLCASKCRLSVGLSANFSALACTDLPFTCLHVRTIE